jgi:hypothetical protein
MLVIDDINRSGRPGPLLERLVAWHGPGNSRPARTGSSPIVRVICPLWPHVVEQSSEAVRSFVHSNALVRDTFSREEAIAAIQARAATQGRVVTDLEANDIATALGDDPLLIAVASQRAAGGRRAIDITSGFVMTGVLQCAASRPADFIEADYLAALDQQSFEMLT